METKEKKSTPEHEIIDFKDVIRLRAYTNQHARMMGRNRTSLTAHEQRRFAQSVKRARFMALMPFVAN